jgi:hypothetical protein
MHLLLTESSAHPGMLATAEAEREYWLSLQKAAVKAPSEIDVHTFHDALGLMYPLNGTVAKLAMRQPFVLFKGLTFQKLCLPGAFRPGITIIKC